MLKKIFDLIINFKEKIVMNLRLFDTLSLALSLTLFSRVVNNNIFVATPEDAIKIYKGINPNFVKQETKTEMQETKTEIVNNVAG
jgi:hypothetical protein